jgi:hypothetical protein
MIGLIVPAAVRGTCLSAFFVVLPHILHHHDQPSIIPRLCTQPFANHSRHHDSSRQRGLLQHIHCTQIPGTIPHAAIEPKTRFLTGSDGIDGTCNDHFQYSTRRVLSHIERSGHHGIQPTDVTSVNEVMTSLLQARRHQPGGNMCRYSRSLLAKTASSPAACS